YMHREIMQPPPGMMVDHIDGNSLDNRRRNMRNCTNQQNMQNLAKSPRASGRFKGVYYDKRRRTWYARICHNGKSIHLGTFGTEIEAARAYDKAAMELFGEFACLNLPDEVGAA
ncbi:MAG: HNH endonuclease, partial [Sedimentisphaerales bacterium]|nr:HNH endonuclease [Sedimentisphaerales bacterium]